MPPPRIWLEMPGLILIDRPPYTLAPGDYTLLVETMLNIIEARRSDAMQDQKALLFIWPEWTCLGAFASPWKALKAMPKGTVVFEFLPDGAVRIDIAGVLFELRAPLIRY